MGSQRAFRLQLKAAWLWRVGIVFLYNADILQHEVVNVSMLVHCIHCTSFESMSVLLSKPMHSATHVIKRI